MNKNYKIEDYIGIIFFIGAIIILLSLIFNPITHLFIQVDEYFTIGLIHLPILNGIQLTAIDVHPPLYYLILKFITKILTFLHISYSTLYVSKLFSILPYFILLLVSGTKIRKEYGWLTAGIFILTIGIMSDFYIYYITARMYSWCLLLLLLSFLSLKGIIENDNTKSWILLTIFTILGAYTQYYVTISSIVLYIILLIYILLKTEDNKINIKSILLNIKNLKFKKWLLSVVVIIISYLPWISITMQKAQGVANGSGSWLQPPNFKEIIDIIISTITPSTTTLIKILAIGVLIIFLYLIISKYKSNEKIENNYILIGIGIFLGTLIITTVISILFTPILYYRYFLPSTGILWFIFSILIGKIENKKKLGILLILILILGVINISTINHPLYDEQSKKDFFPEQSVKEYKLLHELNNNNSIIIYSGGWAVLQIENNLYKTKGYTLDNTIGNVKLKGLKSKLIKTKQLKKIIKKNKNKNIYIITDTHDKYYKKLNFKNSVKIGEIWNKRRIVYVLK